MKTLKLLAAITASMLITSCDKIKEEPKEIIEKATLSAKWIVDNSSEYESFEFDESGSYIVAENLVVKSTPEKIFHFGTYEITGNMSVELSDFGVLTISDIDDNHISFSFKRISNPDNEIIINAFKQEEMEGSPRTDLLCRTWEMVTENGDAVAGTNMELTVLYSKAGTYFVSFANPTEENDGGLAHWMWKDSTETKILYSWEEIPYWNDEFSVVEILELTSTSLKMSEFGDVWLLQPISNRKSALSKKADINSDKLVKKAFFKNKRAQIKK